MTLNPGQSQNAQVQVSTGDMPIGVGDIMFLFDRTGSMSGQIAQAKTSAVTIMNNVRAQLPNAWFGVGSFMDYPGSYSYPGYSYQYGDASYGDVPWELDMNPSSSLTNVAASINNLTMGWGADWPEDYTRALYEVQFVDWRPHSKKIVVLFGDAPTHDLNFAGYNFGGDPGRDGIANTADDLDFETVVQQLANAGITVIAVDSGGTAESAATFKGMSIGFAGVPGTNGQYFLLTDTSQIPTVVVQLIGNETQRINHLGLKVTAGYEAWVNVTPAEYTNVGPNTTKTFDLTITVPNGTSSSFYPFLIQAIGDGTILGLTYVEVTVPSSSTSLDLGFRPDRDGFGFQNFGTDNKWFTTLSWEMFEQFFGSSQVKQPNGNRIHAADEYYKNNYRVAAGDPAKDSANGGVCDGMSALSLINFKGLSQPNAGKFALPACYSPLHSASVNTGLRDAIAFAQGIQMGLEEYAQRQYMCYNLGNSPKGFYQYLKAQIQNGSPAVLGISWKDMTVLLQPFPAGGHALVPYRLEEPSGDTVYAYVYDSNKPGDGGARVEFDLKTNKWKYVLQSLWIIPIVTVEGDSSWCNLSVTPIDMYRHQGVAPWAWAGASRAVKSVMSTSSAQVFATSGLAHLLFTDDQGRRLGWDNVQFYDEIPGASYIPGARGDSLEAVGFYYIPSDVVYTLKLYGYGTSQATVSLWNNGYMVELSGLDVALGTVLSLAISPDGNSLSVSSIAGSSRGSLSLDRILSNEDRTVTIGNLVINPGETVSLQVSITNTVGFSDTIKLSTTSAISRTYDLSLERAGGGGYSVFGHAALVLDANSDAYVNISNWSSLGTITVLVDLNKDGIIETTRPAGNQASTSALTVESNKTTVNTGGEKANLIVSVKDQFGAYVADGTQVSLTTTLGTLSASAGTTSGGLVYTTLTTDSRAGTATIVAQAGSVTGSLRITIESRQIYLPLISRDK